MNVRIFWVYAMKCMCAQTRPRFILSSKTVLGVMEFEPMLTPREISPLPENFPRGGSNPRRCGQRSQTLPTSYSGPQFTSLSELEFASFNRHAAFSGACHQGYSPGTPISFPTSFWEWFQTRKKLKNECDFSCVEISWKAFFSPWSWTDVLSVIHSCFIPLSRQFACFWCRGKTVENSALHISVLIIFCC